MDFLSFALIFMDFVVFYVHDVCVCVCVRIQSIQSGFTDIFLEIDENLKVDQFCIHIDCSADITEL